MSKYRPDYVSQSEYLKKAQESPLRQILINASRMAAVETLQSPRTRFVKRDEPTFVNELTQAQQAAAKLEPQLGVLAQMLAQGQAVRDRETSPRWLPVTTWQSAPSWLTRYAQKPTTPCWPRPSVACRSSKPRITLGCSNPLMRYRWAARLKKKLSWLARFSSEFRRNMPAPLGLCWPNVNWATHRLEVGGRIYRSGSASSGGSSQ